MTTSNLATRHTQAFVNPTRGGANPSQPVANLSQAYAYPAKCLSQPNCTQVPVAGVTHNPYVPARIPPAPSFSQAQMQREAQYRLSVAYLRQMLDCGVISAKDFAVLNESCIQCFRPVWGGL